MINFNEKGQPVEAKPINDPLAYEKENGIDYQIYSTAKPVEPTTPIFNKETVRRLSYFFLSKIEALRQEIRESNYELELTIKNMKLTDQQQLNDSFLNAIQPLEERFEKLVKLASLQSEYNQNIKKKLDVMSLYFNGLSEKMKQLKDVNLLSDKMESMNLRIFNLTKEISGTKSYEIGITEKLNELYENQRKLKEDLLINQENLSKKVENDILLRIQKMIKKTKKRQIKPQKAKVIRFLKNDFQIGQFNKVLIVTDKRNSIFGKILHESVRKLTENSIYVVIENRKNEELLDRSVVEAIKQSDYTFMVGKHTKSEMKEIAETLRNQVKIVLIKRSLKYSIL